MNTLHKDYAEHCARARTQGFKQVPYGWFIKFYAEQHS